jgi:hypothetical protein
MVQLRESTRGKKVSSRGTFLSKLNWQADTEEKINRDTKQI